MNIKKAQKIVNNWIKKYGNNYFSILTNTIILSEEVGEVSSIIARYYGDQIIKKNEKNIIKKLKYELSDVLFCLANQTNINLEKAFYKNIKFKIKRDKNRYINKKI